MRIFLQIIFMGVFFTIGGCIVADAPINVESFTDDKLVYRAWGDDGVGDKTMVVYIHGAVSRGGPADYMYREARRIVKNNQGVVGVALIRPGYYDGEGRKSPGKNYNRRDSCTPHNNAEIAKTIAQLKKQYQAKKVIAVGHSAGAMSIGAIIGYTDDLIDVAVLVSCPCNVPRWRSANGRRPYRRSESPHNFVETIPHDIIVRAVTGEKDNNTFPYLAKDYVAQLKKRGIDAKVQVVSGAAHGYRNLSASVARVVEQFL